MIRCTDCKKSIIEDVKDNDWLKLYHFLCFLRDEEYITETTFESQLDNLMSFRSYSLKNKYTNDLQKLIVALRDELKEVDNEKTIIGIAEEYIARF